jgi:hypothetical protein
MNSTDTTNLILLVGVCSLILICGLLNIVYALYRNTRQTNENNSLLNNT